MTRSAEFEVEAIVSHRDVKKGRGKAAKLIREYLVKWVVVHSCKISDWYL